MENNKGFRFEIKAKDFEYDEDCNLDSYGKNEQEAINWFHCICGTRFTIIECVKKEEVKLAF